MALDKFQPYLFVSAGEQSNKYLTPTYADGIAKFQAQRAQSLTGLTVRIDAIQEGTGDPAPDNIRPISGRTGMTVTRAGKNLLPFPYNQSSSTVYGITFTVNDDGSIKMSGTATGSPYFYLFGNSSTPIPSWFKPNTTYFWHVPTMPSKYFTQLILYGSTSWAQAGGSSFTTPADFSKYTGFAAVVGVYNGASIDGTIYPMLELGSTATTYEPYSGQTYPITWETEAGTIYGGTLDVVSGVLTVTHGYILLDGSQAIRTNGRTEVTQKAFISIDGKAVGTANMQSDRFFVTSSYVVGRVIGRAASNGVEFYLPLDGTEGTDASCKQWFADNNTQLVYELATPQTYQLNPTEIKTLAGFNQIYSDAGPVIDIKF